MNDQQGPRDYLELGSKAIRLKGYHSKYNPKKDYRTAKQPIDRHFTKPSFRGMTLEEIDSWEKKGGWTGWLVPDGKVVIDSEHDVALALVENYLQSIGITPSRQRTNNGKQYLFEHTVQDLTASSEYFCQLGCPVTPRIALKNYVVQPPTNGRTWQVWTLPEDLPDLPQELKPYDPKDKVHIARCLSWAVGEAYRNNQLAGYEDLDCAFLALLVDAEITLNEIQYCFLMIFLEDHDTTRTEAMYVRYSEKKAAGEAVIGAGSFIKKIQDTGLNDILTWLTKMNKLTGRASLTGLTTAGGGVPQYFVDDQGFLCKKKTDRGQDITFRLANFTAEIVEDISEDDGNDIIRKYRLEGSCMGQKLPKIEILASQFAGMSWVHNYGSRASIEPGMTIKDTMRHAIQAMSKNTEYVCVYTHTGWRTINGEMVFLSHESTIGGEGIGVQLGKEIARYSIPTIPEHEVNAIRTSMSFLNIGDHALTLPLLTAVYMAPLTSLFAEFCPINFSFYLYGSTGVFKTTIAVLALCHYGNFTATNLSNLEDTGNSIERRAFLLKDVLMVLDDYHPSYQRRDAQMKEALVQRVIREFSNRTGRGRLTSDSREKGRYSPRGVLMITGEEIASLQSTIARIFVVEVKQGAVDITRLSDLQSLSLCLPHAMSSYLNWIRANVAEIKKVLPIRFTHYRTKATKESGHRKLPEQIAFMMVTLEMMSIWLTHTGAFSEHESEKFIAEGWDIIRQLSEQHGQRIQEEDPIAKFEEYILSMVRTGKVCLVGLLGE